MREIEVELHNHGSYVCGRVKGMSEELRGVGEIIAEDGFVISSLGSPRLRRNELSLRGNLKQYDTQWFNFDYPNEEEACKAIEAFEYLIKKWNALHQGILSEKEKNAYKIQNIKEKELYDKFIENKIKLEKGNKSNGDEDESFNKKEKNLELKNKNKIYYKNFYK